MFQCDICNQLYVLWMTTDKAWKRSIKLIKNHYCGVPFNTRSFICKPCFEECVPNPRYLSLEEYCRIWPGHEQVLSEIWDHPPQKSAEVHEADLMYIYGPIGPDGDRHPDAKNRQPSEYSILDDATEIEHRKMCMANIEQQDAQREAAALTA